MQDHFIHLSLSSQFKTQKIMKRYVLALALVLASSFSGVKAQDEIDFEYGIVDPTSGYEPYEKGPVLVPSVSIEDYTLYFTTPCDGCTLRYFSRYNQPCASLLPLWRVRNPDCPG